MGLLSWKRDTLALFAGLWQRVNGFVGGRFGMRYARLNSEMSISNGMIAIVLSTGTLNPAELLPANRGRGRAA
jgi:hypothetical protein